jgi:dCMP deaminase
MDVCLVLNPIKGLNISSLQQIVKMKEKHIQAFMKTAKNFADCSTANRLHVGCIAVKNDRVISIGYNGTPNGWSNVCEDENGNTIPEVLHAETNMLMKLARSEGGAEGASVFVTHSPCLECAKLIYQAGVVSVYYETEYRSRAGIDFLIKVGVKVEKVSD